VVEPASPKVEAILRRDPDVVYWWGTPLDCASALAAAKRQGTFSDADFQRSQAVIDHLRQRAFEVQPSSEVRARALRIVAVHPLRAPAALQLAAALVWCREHTQGAALVSLDEKLRLAAALEGFRVLPYADEVHAPDEDD
jgi:hypothetical protein